MAEAPLTLEDLKNAIARDIALGVQRVGVDGTNVEGFDILRRIDAALRMHELEEAVDVTTQPLTPRFGSWKFIPPGGG